jgi:DNA-binding XRE family transcriptional regulator
MRILSTTAITAGAPDSVAAAPDTAAAGAAIPTTEAQVEEVMSKLGKDLRNARRRRRISVDTMAQYANISRTTLYKVEMGDSSVAMRVYARVLFVLGKPAIKRLADIVDPACDHWRTPQEKDLPKRIRLNHRVLKG